MAPEPGGSPSDRENTRTPTPNKAPFMSTKTSAALWTRRYSLLVLINFLLYLVFYVLMLWSTSRALSAWGADVSTAGLASGIFIIAALLSRLLMGHFIDGLGRALVLRTGCVLYGVLVAGYFIADGLGGFMVLRFLHGFAYGVASIAASTIVATVIPVKRQAEGIGWYTVGMTIASAAGPFLTIALTHAGDFTAPLWVCAAAGAAVVVMPFFVDAPKHAVTEAERREMRSFRLSTFLEPEAVPISVVGLFAGVCYSAVLSYIGAYAEAADLVEAGSVFFLFFAAAALVTRPLSGRLIDEFGGDVVVYPALGFLVLSMLAVASAHSGAMLVAGGLLLGVGYGTMTSAGHALAVFASPMKHVGRATATFFVLLDVGVGIGPYTLGLLVPVYGFSAVYYAAAATAVLTIAVYWALIGRTGFFSSATMRRVRRLRVEEIRTDGK